MKTPLKKITVASILETLTIPDGPVAFRVSTAEIEYYQSEAKALQGRLARVVQEWDAMKIGPLTDEEMKAMILPGTHQAVEKAVRRRVAKDQVAQVVQLQGITLDQEKVMDLVAIPPVTRLTEAVTIVFSQINRGNGPAYNLPKVCIIDGKAAVDPGLLKAFTDQHTAWTATEQQKRAWLFYSEIADLLTEAQQEFGVRKGIDDILTPLTEGTIGGPVTSYKLRPFVREVKENS